jgi:uncharacterized protein YkwD
MPENTIQSKEDELLALYEEELKKADALVKNLQQKINTIRQGRGLEPLTINELLFFSLLLANLIRQKYI